MEPSYLTSDSDTICSNPEASFFNLSPPTFLHLLPSPMTTTLHSSNPNPNSDTLFSSLNLHAMAHNLPPFSHQTLDDDSQSDSSDLTDFRSPLYSHLDDVQSDAVSQSHSSDLGDIHYTDDLDPNDVVPQSHSQTPSGSGNPNLTSSSSPIPTLLHLSFNQDSGCFAVGTDRGFRIYNCDPFREIFRRDFDSGGGIGVVQMLFRCNILALVGGGPEPEYPLNKVMIWDDHQSRCIGELSFRSEVKSVRLRRDRIVVILAQKIFVYNFADLKLLHQIETIANPKGLCEVSHVSGSMVLVCPSLQKGQVRVEHYASRRTKFIMAHDSRIACFALTNDGRLLATASSKGTLVRVYNTMDGSLLQEVRRGADRADIYSLGFSSTAQWLAVSSDKGTVHVFGLKFDSGSSGIERSRSENSNMSTTSAVSHLAFIKGVLPKYFSSEWSVAQFRLHEGTQYIVAFGHEKNTVVILGMDGSFYRCQFDPVAGGEMNVLECHNV